MARSKNTKPLDQDELDLKNALNAMDTKSTPPINPAVQAKFQSAASAYQKSETKMNIRIDPIELEEIKKRAKREGLKYQSLVKSVLHKYITGQLIEKKAS